MALVVGVHGAFHELWGPHQLAGRWIPALRDGLALAGTDGLTGLVEQIGREQVRRTIAQLGRYFDDGAIRDTVRARVAAVIEPDTVVVVAHSLGSIVAYEVLAMQPGPARLDLVTIGSPLGHQAVVGTDVEPALRDGVGRWPPCVRRWTNITAVRDPVADGRPLAAAFPGVTEARVDNGHRAHDPEPYLCALVTGAAIAAAMG